MQKLERKIRIKLCCRYNNVHIYLGLLLYDIFFLTIHKYIFFVCFFYAFTQFLRKVTYFLKIYQKRHEKAYILNPSRTTIVHFILEFNFFSITKAQTVNSVCIAYVTLFLLFLFIKIIMHAFLWTSNTERKTGDSVLRIQVSELRT